MCDIIETMKLCYIKKKSPVRIYADDIITSLYYATMRPLDYNSKPQFSLKD